jgi:anti-sigma factor RsiW
MNCRTVEAQFGRYLDGDLSPRERAAMDEHLHMCSDCARSWAQLRRTVEMVEGLEEIPARPDFTARVMAAIRPEPQTAQWPLGLVLASAGAALSAAVLLLVAVKGPGGLAGLSVAAAPLWAAARDTMVTGVELLMVMIDTVLPAVSGPFVTLVAVNAALLLIVLLFGRRIAAARSTLALVALSGPC